MTSQFFVISDIHLEKKTQVESDFILNTINEQANKLRSTHVEPVIVFAGDIHNGVQALPWLGKVQAKVVYLAGNHEYWNNDYFETRQALQEKACDYPNIYFLDNDFTVLGDHLFFGGTLWTDIGESLNPDLFAHASRTMNDNHYITCKEWYGLEENQHKVNNMYAHSASKMLEQKNWNVFIEREENSKALKFLENFSEMVHLLDSIKKAIEKLTQSFESPYAYEKLTKEEYHVKMNDLLSYESAMPLDEWWFKNEALFEKLYIDFHFTPSAEKEDIFKRLKSYDLTHLKFVGVSHHLPFLEERLVGRQEWFDDKINENYINHLNTDLFTIHKGHEYPYVNYFWRLGKGEMNKDENILAIIHYHNNGSVTFPDYLLRKTECWIHGHEHHYNYEDYLKGIKIATNPLYFSMGVFEFNGSQPGLNKYYKANREIENEAEEIQNLKDSFLRSVKLDISPENIINLGQMWTLKHFNWDEYERLQNHFEKANLKLLKYALKNFQAGEVMNAAHEFNITLLMDSINVSQDKMKDMERKLSESVCLRTSYDYTFDSALHHTCERIDMGRYLRKTDEKYHVIHAREAFDAKWGVEHLMHQSFYNIEYMKLNRRQTLKMKAFMQTFEFNRIHEVSVDMLERFENNLLKSDRHIFFMELNQKLATKFAKLREKIAPPKTHVSGYDF